MTYFGYPNILSNIDLRNALEDLNINMDRDIHVEYAITSTPSYSKKEYSFDIIASQDGRSSFVLGFEGHSHMMVTEAGEIHESSHYNHPLY